MPALSNPAQGYVGDVYARVTADIRPIKADLKKVQDEMRKFKEKSAQAGKASAKAIDDSHSAVRRFANGMTTAFRVLLAFKAAAGVAKAAWEAVIAAAKASEIENKFMQTFDDMQVSARAMSQSLARDFDLADSSAQKLLATTGDLLSGFGFTDQQAAELANTANRLALDLVSFQNIEGGAEKASEAMTKAMLGNTRMAKQLGIVIRQDTDEFREQVKVLQEANGWTVQQAKAVAILEESMKQSKNAIGDYNRTQEETMNVTRAVSEQWKEAKEGYGSYLELLLRGTGVMGATRDALGGIGVVFGDFVGAMKGETDNNFYARLFRDADEYAEQQASILIAEEKAAEFRDSRAAKDRTEAAQAAKRAKDRSAYMKQNLEDAKQMEKAFKIIEDAKQREWRNELRTMDIVNQVVAIRVRERDLKKEMERASDPVAQAQAEIALAKMAKLRMDTLEAFSKKRTALNKEEAESKFQLIFGEASQEKKMGMLLAKRNKLLRKIRASEDLQERKRLNIDLLNIEKDRLGLIEDEQRISNRAKFSQAIVKGTQEAFSAELAGTFDKMEKSTSAKDKTMQDIQKKQLEISKQNIKLQREQLKAFKNNAGVTLVKGTFR